MKHSTAQGYNKIFFLGHGIRRRRIVANPIAINKNTDFAIMFLTDTIVALLLSA
jgi:hypothetical protein